MPNESVKQQKGGEKVEEKKDTVGKMIDLLRKAYPSFTDEQKRRYHKLIKDYTKVIDGFRKLMEESTSDFIKKAKTKENGTDVKVDSNADQEAK